MATEKYCLCNWLLSVSNSELWWIVYYDWGQRNLVVETFRGITMGLCMKNHSKRHCKWSECWTILNYCMVKLELGIPVILVQCKVPYSFKKWLNLPPIIQLLKSIGTKPPPCTFFTWGFGSVTSCRGKALYIYLHFPTLFAYFLVCLTYILLDF